MYYCNYNRSEDSEGFDDLDDIYQQEETYIPFYCPYYRQFFQPQHKNGRTPFANYSREISGQKPLSYLGSYLTQISNNVSTTGADITTATVPVKPLIKVVFDKNVVDDLVWTNNQKYVTMQTSTGASVPSQVSRIPDTVNFDERQHIFITPLSNLLPGTKYRIVISPNLLAKNLLSTLGGTTNNQPVTVNFTTAAATVVAVTGVTLNKTTMSITEGQTATLVATVTPTNVTNKSVTWTSSDTTVTTVNQSGIVTAVKPGVAVITVKTVDGGKTASCIATVVAKQIIYYVKSGDTLYKIALVYGLGTNDLLIANNLTSTSVLYIGQPIIIPTIAHIVQSGDTINTIATKYGATANSIIIANNLSSTGTITLGQKLFVPINLRIYTVISGDTLSLIAQKNATTVDNLVRLNNIDPSKPLNIGQKLKVNY